MQLHHRITLCLLVLPSLAIAQPHTPADDHSAVLESSELQLQLTSAFGGRVLSLQRKGEPNFLRIGAAVRTQPDPAVNASSDDIAYLGHDVWVGPQS